MAEELHFGRAAERLHISQPPLSQQIRDLEMELGVRLFHRLGRRVEISEPGKVFLEHARAALAQVGQGVRSAQRTDRGELGRLVVGFMSSMAYTYLPWVLRVYRERFPDVELELYEKDIPAQIRALREGQLQVGLLRPPVNGAELAAETVLAESFVLALPTCHPLGIRDEVSLRALADEPLIMFPRRIGGRFYEQVLGLCHQAGFSPRIAQEVTQMHAAIGLVGARIGVALVPASIQVLSVTGVVFRPLAEITPRAEIAVAWRRNDEAPPLHAFVEVAREVISRGLQGLNHTEKDISRYARYGSHG